MNAIVKELETVLGEMPRLAPPAQCALPCNEHMFRMLTQLQSAVLVLDELLAVVARIELGDGEPTIHLQQPPREGAVSGICELVRIEAGERVVVKRARFVGCTVEWRSL